MKDLAIRLNWRGSGLARRRSGRGGGWEYHWKLFPLAAQKALLATVAAPALPSPGADRGEAWSWFEALPQPVQDKARARLLTIQKVEALEARGIGRFLAVDQIARMEGVSPRTVWNWFAAVEGVRIDDRLPYLAPRHRAAVRKDTRRDVDPAFLDIVKSDYLRPAQPSFTSCYRRAVRIAEAQGIPVPAERTARRRFDETVSEVTQVLARKGVDALKRLYPAQTRDKSALHALEAVNADFHKFDVFVLWPGETVPCRPQMVAFQDIHSGRLLSWRVDQTANSTAVMLAAGDMIEDWGIPEHVVLDNGREFAAKAITGGAPTRFRFKVREDDLPGLFVALGCEVHWATPYSGQSKPIERAFRDLCDAVAKDPRFDGAWTGNRPEAKPEDYGSRAIPLDQFLSVLAEGIEEHNLRQGRRSEVAWGRSFAEVFAESYARAPIRKATEAQRRLWLLGAEGLRAHSTTGVVRFQGNEYWAEWMHEIAGERVVVRFDPADLWSGVHVYSAANAYLGHAPCKLKAGFFSIEEARSHQRARTAWMSAERKALAAHRKFQAAEIGAQLDALTPPSAPPVEAKVVRPVFAAKPAAAPAPAVQDPGFAAAQAAVVADLAARRAPKAPEETQRERFKRALDLERSLDSGRAVTAEQQRWLSIYQTTPEYRAERALWDDFGDAIFG